MTSPESLASPRLWVAFTTMMLVSGISNAFPVFLPPLLDEFGGSRAATTVTVSLFWICGAVLGPVAGRLVDRWDPRRVIIAGLGATALGLVVAAGAPTLVVFTLALGIGGGAGVGLTGMVSQAAVMAETYRRRRGFATGIAFSGSMVGYALATPAHWAITLLGWRGTFLVWSAIVLVLVPCVLASYPSRLGARGRPETAPARGGPIRGIVGSGPFWALAVVFTLAPLVGYLATIQHSVYFLSIGFSAGEAAAMLLAGGLLSTLGRALVGLAADRFGAAASGLVSLSCSLVGVLCLVALELWPARLLAYGYVLFVFLPLGTRATLVSILASRIAPAGRYGTVFGALTIGNHTGAALGPFLSGAIYDLTHSYLVIYVAATALLAVALAALAVFVRATTPRGG